MLTPIIQPLGRFSPYVPLSGFTNLDEDDANNSPLRAVLIDKTCQQLEVLIRTINAEDLKELPPVLVSMALENRHTLMTLLNMLYAYQAFLTDTAHADIREKLAVVFRPMDAWVQGQYCVTTPALLIIQAILYSHSEWFREELFESYSAVRAFEELELLGFPERDRYFIAAIIAHQTLLRAAWSIDPKHDPREVFAFFEQKDGQLKFAEEKDQDQVLGLALQHTLYPFLEERSASGNGGRDHSNRPNMLRRQLASALIWHALCLQCRHSRYGAENLPLEIKDQALAFLDHLLAAEREQKFPKATLAFFHYGRYVHQAQMQAGFFGSENLFCKGKQWVENYLESRMRKYCVRAGGNISLCFQRVSSKKVWSHIRRIRDPNNNDTGQSVLAGPVLWRSGLESPARKRWTTTLGGRKLILRLVEDTVGETFWKLKIDSEEYLLWVLGLDKVEQGRANRIKKDISDWIKGTPQ